MRFLIETVVFIVFAATAIFVYQSYGDTVRHALFGDEERHTIYLGSTALQVTVADEPKERLQGLSGVPSLDDFEGKLFIFDTDDKHGIWMKDMLIPLDIIWINKDLEVIHIEENVEPSSYPNTIFAPPTDARFVLEVNAFFVSSIKVDEGERLTLPPGLIPMDVRRNLQQ